MNLHTWLHALSPESTTCVIPIQSIQTRMADERAIAALLLSPPSVIALRPIRIGIYSHFWLLLQEYTGTCMYMYMYTYMYIDIHRIQHTDSMAPSFVKFCQVYHAFARAHTSVYFGPILLLHEYTLHSYTTKYTLHYVYSNPDLDFLAHHSRYSSSTQYTACSTRCTS